MTPVHVAPRQTTIYDFIPAAPRVLNLFAGPGGREEGLALVGVHDTLGIEMESAPCKTGRAAGHARLQADVTALNPRDFHGSEGHSASPVCRPWTTAGTGLARLDAPLLLAAIPDMAQGRDVRPDLREKVRDQRSLLSLEPLRWALALNPDWVAWEQVKEALPLWKACEPVFRDRGYAVHVSVLDAEQYGVPACRRRAVFLASRHGEVRRPVPTHSRYHVDAPDLLDPDVLPWVAAADVLDLPAGTYLRSNYSHGGDLARRGERPASRPSFAVTGKFDRNFWHFPDGTSRRVTVDEAATLQTFRTGYPFHGKPGEQFQQIGDAVPPLLDAHCYQALGVGRIEAAEVAA